jgi:hypothetical protein
MIDYVEIKSGGGEGRHIRLHFIDHIDTLQNYIKFVYAMASQINKFGLTKLFPTGWESVVGSARSLFRIAR